MLKAALREVSSWILSPTAECKHYSVANSSRLIADNDGSVLENIIRTCDSGSSDYDLLTNNDWSSEWVEQKRIKTENQQQNLKERDKRKL